MNRLMKVWTTGFVAMALALPLAAVAYNEMAAHNQPQTDLVSTLENSGRFTTLVSAIRAAGLEEVLSGGGPFTVFAPNDAAFQQLPAGKVQSLLQPENRDALVSLLSAHVVPGWLAGNDLYIVPTASTLGQGTLTLSAQRGGISVNGATVVTHDIGAVNGVIHEVSSVIQPSESSRSDAAGAETPQSLLGAASDTPSISTFVKALEVSGVADSLKAGEQYTIFAPTDAAFQKVPQDALQSLFAPENRHQLEHYLKQYIVKGRYTEEDLAMRGAIPASAIGGGEVAFKSYAGESKVGDAQVVDSNGSPVNGVIHVVDSVEISKDGFASLESK